MKLAKMLVCVCFLAACGNSATPAPPDLAQVTPPDLFTKQCVSSCTTHQQCQNSCAPAPVGANCCDTVTSTCYVVATAMCPAPPMDMTVVAPY